MDSVVYGFSNNSDVTSAGSVLRYNAATCFNCRCYYNDVKSECESAAADRAKRLSPGMCKLLSTFVS